MERDELADNLEEYASSRAMFYEASDEQREQIARELLLARRQAQNNPVQRRAGQYRSILIRKRSRYFHLCGEANIDFDEAERIWWNVVHDDPAPADRVSLV